MDDPIDRLIAAVAKSGLKQTHIARLAHLHRTKLNKILKRNQVPTVPEFIDISRAIKLDPALLFTEGDLVVELTALREAHKAAQRATQILARWLPEEAVPYADATRPVPKRPASRFRSTVGAAANPNAELVVELEEEQNEIPLRAWNRGARIVARAIGDSMDGGDDPIGDGALVYVKPARNPATAKNKIALVRRDDGLFLKRFETDGPAIRLISANGAPPIEIDARGENMQIYGYVVDHE
jgi:lambda repressor-like predicted transcriptional regulator